MNENLTKMQEYLEETYTQLEEAKDIANELYDDKVKLEDILGMVSDIVDYTKEAFEQLETVMSLLEDAREEIK